MNGGAEEPIYIGHCLWNYS